MVYPEKLNLDQISTTSNKQFAHYKSTTNWCSEPLEETSNNIHLDNNTNVATYVHLTYFIYLFDWIENCCRSSTTNVNRQFIQDRIRHLVEAFSTRAQVARECLDTPATPSSISSRETVEPTPSSTVNQKPKLSISFSDKYEQNDNNDGSVKNQTPRKFSAMNRSTIDPNGTTYCTWMSIAALAVVYNAWVIPLRATFPSQTPHNRPVWMAFDYLADFIYVIDMVVVQPRVRYLNEGFWVTDLKLLRHNYIKNKHFKVCAMIYSFKSHRTRL